MSDESDFEPAMPATGGAFPRDERWLARLRWRCRRGMLENDLILSRYLDARGQGISDAEVAALNRFLELRDNELCDLLSGRQVTAAPELVPVIRAIWSLDAAGAPAGDDAKGTIPQSRESHESSGRIS